MKKEVTTLHAGPIRAIFYEGDLRYVTLNGHEVLRRIYMAVRDTRWGTVKPVFRDLVIRQEAEGFEISYVAEYREGEIEFSCRVDIRARGAGDEAQISFAMAGAAKTTFGTNRTGLCVLHPSTEYRSQPCEVEQIDGERVVAAFPELVSPHQPFTRVQAMRTNVGGVAMTVRFEGEAFETEDQRNWTDTSFKTYSRPLVLPRRQLLNAGQEVRQTVHVSIARGKAASATRDAELVVGQPVGKLPAIGLQINDVPAAAVVAAVRKLGIGYLRHDVHELTAGWKERLADITQLGWPIELGLHVTDEAELARLGALPSAVERVCVYRNRKAMTDAALAAAARSLCLRPVGGGTIANFAEVNRNRPAPGSLDFLSFSITPQVHATDDLSLMENLAAQGDVVRTARSFLGATPLRLCPIAMHRRPDPFAAGNDGRPTVPAAEPRQTTAFAAAWTVGSLKYLSEAGADALTFYDVAGPVGTMDDGGVPYPLYHVFEQLADFSGGEVLHVSDPRPLAYVGFAIRKNGRTRLLIANVGWDAVDVPVAGHGTVHLPEYGVKAIDLEGA